MSLVSRDNDMNETAAHQRVIPFPRLLLLLLILGSSPSDSAENILLPCCSVSFFLLPLAHHHSFCGILPTWFMLSASFC